jgi:hypothetical protein
MITTHPAHFDRGPLYGIEFRMPRGRKWRKSSLTMRDKQSIEQAAKELTAQEGWSEHRIVIAS